MIYGADHAVIPSQCVPPRKWNECGITILWHFPGTRTWRRSGYYVFELSIDEYR